MTREMQSNIIIIIEKEYVQMIQLEQCRSSPKVITRSINTKGVLDLQTKMIWGKCLQRMLLHTPWSIQAKMT